MHSIIFVLCLSSYFRLARCQSLAAWSTGVGDQIIYQNVSSGDLLYSIDTGAEWFTSWAQVPVTTPPKAGSRLAGTGYTGADGNIYGQIFYVSSAGDMVEAEVICTLPKANCTLQRSNIISSEMVSGVNSNTDLAATLRSDTDGYRVFYHDSTSTIRQIRMYYPNITWGPGVSVISDTNERLTGITTDRGVSLSVYGVDSVGNIKTSTLASNESWQESISIPSQNLQAWDPTNITLAATVGTNNVSKSLFYIGTDRELHGIATSNNWQTTSALPGQDPKAVALADEPNAIFAATFSGGTSSFYYISGGSLVKATLENGSWQKAVPIFNSTTTQATSSSKALSANAKIGLGVGLGLGIPVLAALGIFVVILKRRKGGHGQKKIQTAEGRSVRQITTMSRTPSIAGPPVPEKNPFEILGREISEMGGDEKYELSDPRNSWDPQNEKLSTNWL